MANEDDSDEEDSIEIQPPEDAPDGYQMEWNAAATGTSNNTTGPIDEDDEEDSD